MEMTIDQFAAECQSLPDRLDRVDIGAALKNDVAPIVNQATRDNFTGSHSPLDIDWPARKVEGDGHPLLMDTGALLQAATGGGAGHIEEYGAQGLAVGVDGGEIPYAAVHNRGGGNNIPEREFEGPGPMSEPQERIDEIIDEAVYELVWAG